MLPIVPDNPDLSVSIICRTYYVLGETVLLVHQYKLSVMGLWNTISDETSWWC